MHYVYNCKMTCSSKIEFDIDEDGIVTNITFYGGCSGNLKAISKLLEGSTSEYIIEKLKGNTCGFKTTSCADQLAIAVEEAYEKIKK